MNGAASIRLGRWTVGASVGGLAALALGIGVASAHQGIPPGQTPATTDVNEGERSVGYGSRIW